MEITAFVGYPLHAVLLNRSVMYTRWIIENGLFSIHCLPTQFKAKVVCGAESQFKKNSAHYWFIGFDEALPKEALTLSEHSNLEELETFLINDDISDLLARFHAG